MEGNRILVSVVTITYNHEKYIRDCLEGIVMQKTDFAFELLIHDDASTDNTANIIREYEHRFPDIIKPIYQTENQYSKGVPLGKTFLYPRAKGKYIALCEGDDYWTDPLKLQKQVDFLEVNEEYGLVHSNCDIYYQEKDIWKHNANSKLNNHLEVANKKELFSYLVKSTYQIRTASAIFRRDLLEDIISNKTSFMMGDTPMWLDFSQKTKFKYFEETMTVYRVSNGTASKPYIIKDKLRFKLSSAEMRIYYHEKYSYEIEEYLKKRYNIALANYSIFDPGFKPLYPIFGNNSINAFKFNTSKNIILNIIFKFNFHVLLHTRSLARKFKSQLQIIIE